MFKKRFALVGALVVLALSTAGAFAVAADTAQRELPQNWFMFGLVYFVRHICPWFCLLLLALAVPQIWRLWPRIKAVKDAAARRRKQIHYRLQRKQRKRKQRLRRRALQYA